MPSLVSTRVLPPALVQSRNCLFWRHWRGSGAQNLRQRKCRRETGRLSGVATYKSSTSRPGTGGELGRKMKLRRFFRSISIHSTFLFGTCGHQLNKKLQRTTTESSAEGQDASKAAEGSNHKKPREAKETKRRGPLLARCRERERGILPYMWDSPCRCRKPKAKLKAKNLG